MALVHNVKNVEKGVIAELSTRHTMLKNLLAELKQQTVPTLQKNWAQLDGAADEVEKKQAKLQEQLATIRKRQ